jgi:hypothetical protein
MNRLTTCLTALTAACLCTLTFAGPLPEGTPSNEQEAAKPFKAAADELATAPQAIPRPNTEPVFHVADINRDFVVDINDLFIVVMLWGDKEKGAELSPADIAPEGGDYRVGFDDMMLVLTNWGSVTH